MSSSFIANGSEKMRKAIACVLLCISTCFAFDAVTYPKEGSRFGDRLIAYIHAKWISFRDGVPLLYHPFPYSEYLILSQEEMHMGEIAPFIHPSQIFVCPYFPESKWELKCDFWKDTYFETDFTNREFIHNLKTMIAPLEPLQCTYPPPNTISLALHLRDGGGYDPADFAFALPAKFPPLSFYSIALNKVLELLGNRPIFCYLFTDAKNPAKLVVSLQRTIAPDAPITFEYRKNTRNAHDKNVLEDFFSFQNFDILIRPDSNFSMVPSLIHPFAIVCSPLEFSFDEQGQVHTEDIEIAINEPLLQKLLLSYPPLDDCCSFLPCSSR